GLTPLHGAVTWGNPSTLELSLDTGVDTNVNLGTYGTALQSAAASNDIAIVEIILSRGTDVKILGVKG
ncbi:hypothetical protein DFP73DRAFT_469133, partial [Morchella snyderi]